MHNPTDIEIREWLQKQITARKLMCERLLLEEGEYEYDNVYLKNFSSTDSIHIDSNLVRVLAKRLYLDLCVKRRAKDITNPYEIFFIYDGEVFFGLETQEEYDERGHVV